MRLVSTGSALFVTISNREDPDETASEDSPGSALFVQAFLAGN